jgi:protein neuralized
VIDPALAAGRLRVNLPCSVSNGTSGNGSGASESHGQHNGVPVPVPVSQRFCCAGPTPPPAATAELVQYQPSVGGGTVLVVNLPPAHSNYLNQQNQQNQHQHQSASPAVTTQHHMQSSQPSVPVDLQPSSSGTLLSTYSHTYIEVSVKIT